MRIVRMFLLKRSFDLRLTAEKNICYSESLCFALLANLALPTDRRLFLYIGFWHCLATLVPVSLDLELFINADC